MAVAITVTKEHDLGSGLFLVRGTLVFSGTYPTGGEAFSLVGTVHSLGTPLFFLAVGKAGFVYEYDKSANKVMVFTNSAGGVNAALTEHSAVAYVAGVTGDTIDFIALYTKLI